jgi:hypothetical protein
MQKTMTLDKDRKRIIRSRMKTTGESYTTARRHVLARAAQRNQRQAATGTSVAVVNHAALAGMSDAKIKQQTGHDWPDWVRLLDADGAAEMTHGQVARIVHDKYGVADWWSQTVTVGYERVKGRRERGQRMDGAYEASKSKTFRVPVATLFDAFADKTKRRRWLDGVDASVRTATAPKSMRLQWPDGTIVALWFTSKGDAKSAIALAHTKLTTRAAMEKAKTDWGTRLDRLARLLAGEGR